MRENPAPSGYDLQLHSSHTLSHCLIYYHYFCYNIFIRKQVVQLINMLMGLSTFILIRNTMKVSMFAVQKSSLPKGVGLLSWTLRRTGDPPETWVPNLNREPCCQYMQSTENHCLKSLKSCLKVETNLAALEWLWGKVRPTLWSAILVYFISLFFSPVFLAVSDISG